MSVLTIVTRSEDAAPLVHWGTLLARARGVGLTVLYLGRGTKAQAPVEVPLDGPLDHPVLAAARDAIVAATGPERSPVAATTSAASPAPAAPAPAAPAPRVTLERALHPEPSTACLARIEELRAELTLVAVGAHAPGDPDERLAARLVRDAPCDLVLLRASGAGRSRDGGGPGRVVVPTAGGPHARVALRLAAALARTGAEVEAIYVEPDFGDEALPVGQRRLRDALAAADVHEDVRVTARVIVSDRPVAAIVEAARGADLVLIGASNEGLIERVLFGTIPQKVLARGGATDVAVLRARAPIARRTWESLRRRLESVVPQLERDERVALFDRLQGGSTWNVDFMALMGLATAIAALGLLQSSAATVIGAMLVAPLMTPMIGSGLALVQGNEPLARNATKAIVRGFLMALGLGLLFGLLVPIGLTPELAARGAPTLIDLGVAFFSGVAAAYALARPNLSGAMAGVAIAAALVPPVAAVGISLGHGELDNARGAALLFATNLVAIVLGSATVFRAMGVRGRRDDGPRRLWVRRAILVLLLAGAGLTIPLTTVLFGQLARYERRTRLEVTPALVDDVERALGAAQVCRVVAVTVVRGEDDHDLLRLVIGVQEAPTPARADALARAARSGLPAGVGVEVVLVGSAWTTSGG